MMIKLLNPTLVRLHSLRDTSVYFSVSFITVQMELEAMKNFKL